MKVIATLSVAGCVFLLSGCGDSHDKPGRNTTTTPSPTTTKHSSSTSLLSTTTTTTGSTTPPLSDLWTCQSSRSLPQGVVNARNKGMAVDDPTLQLCSDKITGQWPHAQERVTSLRLFAAWKPEWPESQREQAWSQLVDFVHHTNAMVLMGTEVKCNAGDDQMWNWAKQLMQRLGRKHIMGLAIGNELDNQNNNQDCWSQGLWNNFFERFNGRIQELDAMEGFQDLPVTTVWSMGVLNGAEDPPWNPTFNSFLQQAHSTWGERFIYSFNPYPIWDHSLQPQSPGECDGKVDAAIKLDYTKSVMTSARKRVTAFTQNPKSTVWATESGWSSPGVDQGPQKAIVSRCPRWADKETLWTFYRNIMEWDLSLNDGQPDVDHLFYFTMRDARGESFGLLSDCNQNDCKLQGQAPFSANATAVVI